MAMTMQNVNQQGNPINIVGLAFPKKGEPAELMAWAQNHLHPELVVQLARDTYGRDALRAMRRAAKPPSRLYLALVAPAAHLMRLAELALARLEKRSA
jgi:hypothetical protein